MFITLAWTDADVTKDWLGCTWNRGETKEVFTTTYAKHGTPVPSSPYVYYEFEVWDRATGVDQNDQRFRLDGFVSASGGFGHFIHHRIAAGQGLRVGTGISPDYDSVAAFTPAYSSGMFGGPFAPMTDGSFQLVRVGSGYLQSGQFTGMVTFTDGLTISWSQGSGW